MQKCVAGELSLRIVLSDIVYAKASRKDIAFSIRAFRFGVCITAQISFLLCKFNQKSGVFSNTFASNKAVSTVTVRFPVQSSLTVLRLPSIAWARKVVVEIEKKWGLYDENGKFIYQGSSSNYQYGKFAEGEKRLSHSQIQFYYIVIITMVGITFVCFA
jgi:hypothetical protein